MFCYGYVCYGSSLTHKAVNRHANREKRKTAETSHIREIFYDKSWYTLCTKCFSFHIKNGI